jgi:hypothetical protein
MTDVLGEDGALFDYEAPPPVGLHDKFGMPPFSVLDRRGGIWQDRKRRWLSLGIRSELGRDGGLIYDLEGSGMGQGVLPVERRSDRTLQSMVANSDPGSPYARKAAEELERRKASGRRVLDGSPPPGGGGTGAWKGRTADGAMRSIDPKWDSKEQGGTPRQLIPGAGGTGGAYDRSRPEGVLHKSAYRTDSDSPGGGDMPQPSQRGHRYTGRHANPDDATTDAAMTARPLSSGGAFMTAEERMSRQRLNEAGAHKDQDKLNAITGQDTLTGTSIFDPVLCELAYRWFTGPGMRVLDPFAGGSVRGIVASYLERHYFGIDLRGIQIEANKQQGEEIVRNRRFMPRWVSGDSREVLARAPAESVDFVWSCPPYADLEVYSDDPRDISGMEYYDFLAAHDEIVAKACAALKPDRFAAWVISDVRDKRGVYRGLPAAVVDSFRKAGLELYNEAIILDPVGSAAVRAGRIFLGGRKLTRMHQFLLVFVKGDWKRATQAVSAQEQVLEAVAQEAKVDG